MVDFTKLKALFEFAGLPVDIEGTTSEIIEPITQVDGVNIARVPYLVGSDGYARLYGEDGSIYAQPIGQWYVDAANAQLTTWQTNETTKAFVDFVHMNKSAAGMPLKFEWVEGVGILLQVAVTDDAKEALESGAYKYFSSQICLGHDQTYSMICMPNVGGLCNDPANLESKPIFMYNSKTSNYSIKKNSMANEPEVKVDAPVVVEVPVVTAPAKVEEPAKPEVKVETPAVNAKDKDADAYLAALVKAGKVESAAVAQLKADYLAMSQGDFAVKLAASLIVSSAPAAAVAPVDPATTLKAEYDAAMKALENRALSKKEEILLFNKIHDIESKIAKLVKNP